MTCHPFYSEAEKGISLEVCKGGGQTAREDDILWINRPSSALYRGDCAAEGWATTQQLVVVYRVHEHAWCVCAVIDTDIGTFRKKNCCLLFKTLALGLS